MLTPEIRGALFVVGSLLILAEEVAGKPNGTNHSVSLRGRADDPCAGPHSPSKRLPAASGAE